MSPVHVCCLRLTARSRYALPPALAGAPGPLGLLSARSRELQFEITIDGIDRPSVVRMDERLSAVNLLYLHDLFFL